MNYNDVFNEQLVKKKMNGTDIIKGVGMVAAGLVIIFASAFIIPGAMLFIAAAVIVGEVFFIRRLNLEFEYAFTNGDLDIDTIYNQTKRKNSLSIDVRNFIVMIKVNDPNFKSEVGNITEVKNFGTGVVTDTTYAAVYEQDGKRIQLVFDPNEQVFNGIKMYIPKKIK